MPSNITNGKTLANPYVFDPNPADPLNYTIIPLITVGDEVPLLQGTFGNFTTSATETFAMAGIPDGLGYVEINGIRYVFMNHELSGNTIDPVTGQETSPPTTTATNSLGNEVINGARVSLWQFDQNWNAIGGKNLIEDVLLDGITYSLNTLTGNYEDPLGNVLTFFNHENFTRFCSGYLAAQGFVDANNRPIPIWFAPQERADGVGTPVQANGLATPIRGLGTVSKENILAASQYRADNSEFTVLLASEDNTDGELYLYVGRQTPGNPNGFWGTVADGANFDLYVLRVKDQAGNVYGYETMPENVPLVTEWVAIPDDIAVNPDPAVLSEFVNRGPNPAIDPDPVTGLFPATNVLTAPDTAANSFNSTNFRRLEDIAEDPNNPNTYYFVTTGRNDVVPVNGYFQPNPLDGLDTPPQGATTARDNPLGKLHRFDVVLDANGIPLAGTFENLLQGGRNKGVSYDNIVVDRNGKVLIQEDETADGDVIFAVENRDGSVLSYDIAANEGIVGNDTVDFLFEINSAAADTANISFFEIGGWETSGIIEIDPNSAPRQSSYLFDVQASTIATSDSRLRETQTYNDLIASGFTDTQALDIVRPAAQEVLGGQYERGGQLLLVEPANATNPTPTGPSTPVTPVEPSNPGNPGIGITVREIARDQQNLIGGLSYEVLSIAPGQQDRTVRLSDDVINLGTEAAFDNIVCFYEVLDPDLGTIDDGGLILNPGDIDYARVAIENRITEWEIRGGSSGDPVFNTTIEQLGNVIVSGDRFYAPLIVVNGGTLGTLGSLGFDEFIAAEDAETDGIFNDAADFVEDIVAYFGFEAANPDGARHLQARGNNVFGFEDLPFNLPGFTPDLDYNDCVFAFNFT